MGTEVKPCVMVGASIVDGFRVTDNEMWPGGYSYCGSMVAGTWTNHAACRRRVLPLHRLEINKLAQKLKETTQWFR